MPLDGLEFQPFSLRPPVSLFSADLYEFMGAQENLCVLLETRDFPFFSGQEAQANLYFNFRGRTPVEKGVGQLDTGLVVFFFFLQPLRERLGAGDHEGAVQHEEVLLRYGTRDPLRRGAREAGDPASR